MQSRGVSLLLSLVLFLPILLGGCDQVLVVGAPLDAGTETGDGTTMADADSGPAPGWALALGGEGEESFSRVVIDPAGDLVLLGRYTNALTLEGLGGPIALPGSAGGRTFLAKLDPQARKLRWALSLDGVPVRSREGFEDYRDEGTDGLGVDAAGNIYVAGKFRRSATFGATTLVSAGGLDIFVLKLDPAGKPLWAVSAGGPGDDDAEDLAVGPYDRHEVLMICGLFASTATFSHTTLGAAGRNDLFAARLDTADGRFVWAVRAGSDSTTVKREWASGIALDPGGDSYIVGGVAGTASFGADKLLNGPVQVAYFAKLDPAGRFVMVKPFKASQHSAIAIGPTGTAHKVGGYGGGPVSPFGDTEMVVSQGNKVHFTDLSLSTYSFDHSAYASIVNSLVNGYIWPREVAGDGRGNTVVVGSFGGTADFGEKKLTGGGGFFARMRPDGTDEGTFFEARQMSGSRAAGLAVDRVGGIYVVGTFSDTVDFGGHPLSSHQGTYPARDAFVWYTGRAED